MPRRPTGRRGGREREGNGPWRIVANETDCERAYTAAVADYCPVRERDVMKRRVRTSQNTYVQGDIALTERAVEKYNDNGVMHGFESAPFTVGGEGPSSPGGGEMGERGSSSTRGGRGRFEFTGGGRGRFELTGGGRESKCFFLSLSTEHRVFRPRNRYRQPVT